MLKRIQFSLFGKKQNQAKSNALAAPPLAPIGNSASQDHQGSTVLASDVSGNHGTSILRPAVSRSSFKIESKELPTLPSSGQQLWPNIFSQNVAPSTLSVAFPPPGTRFENTAQLAHCGNLLRKCLSPSLTATSTPDKTIDPVQHALIDPYLQDKYNANCVSSLIERVVEEFSSNSLKTAAVLSEVLLLVPSLDKEHYRKLLNCVIAEFETAELLEIALLQGLIQLVEGALPDYLEPDDLVRILVVLRTRLQDTHQQSTKHPYYLTWALSHLFDAMVEGKVKDLRRVVDQEPLSTLFNQLKDSDEIYLKHQVAYAFQGLLHIPNDETRRQCMLRYVGNITMGLLGVASVCKLDLGQLKDGVDHLYEAAGDAHEVGTKITDGVRSLFESGQGIWASVKGGILSGGRQLWYTSLREAQQHIRNGRLHDFKKLVFEASCRDQTDFQWGVCRLIGGIAVDPLWETSTRQQAVAFLAELYRNDSMWASNEDTSNWILDILRMIAALKDVTTSDHALLALQSLEKSGNTAQQKLYRDTLAGPLCSYPIQVRLPITETSTLLLRVLAIPAVESDLLKLKKFCQDEYKEALYIQPMAKPSLQSSDTTLFPLMEMVLEFLAGPGLVFLLLGDSGGGKSTFNLQLARTLWNTYKDGGPIPLHINLPSINNPQQDMIVKRLRRLNFNEAQIMELKQNRQFIVICDGYDESQLMSNIYASNDFNRPGQWKVKMIITCRTQYLGSNYQNLFIPQGGSAYDRPTLDLFREAFIAPFTKEQIKRYVDIYVPLEPRTWSTKNYMDRLNTIPNVMDLVKNPFLLNLALEALPGVTNAKRDLSTIRVTRIQLYDTFVKHWLEVNQRRLQKNNDALSKNTRSMLNQLVEAGFVSLGIEYSIKLAQAVFDKQAGNPVIQYVEYSDKSTWKNEFFGSQPEVRLLRESSPLIRTGNQYRFIHRSLLEYFFSRGIYNPTKNDEGFDTEFNNPLFQRSLLKEPSIIQFLCERVELNPGFVNQLRAVIDLSKTDANAAIAAANAITILVRAGVNFNGKDLREIKIPGADLSGGQFDFAQFQGADLTDVDLSKSWMREVDMSDACMEGVRFGELSYLEMDEFVYSCTYSPDGKMLGVALNKGIIHIYNSSTWTRTHRLKAHEKVVRSIAFSPDSQRLISGSDDKTVRLWDAIIGNELLVMEGHGDAVFSVTISPCGNQIASVSGDNTVILWNAHTGEKLFVKKHPEYFKSVMYSPDGGQLVSGCFEGTIRIWDTRTEESGIVLGPSSGEVRSLTYSPDGLWIAVGHGGGDLHLWETGSWKAHPNNFSGHAKAITGISFSPDNRWLASSSDDQTVKLWDASTGTLITVFTGHNEHVSCVAFSPDGFQIASGGYDRKARLWEVNSSWSSLCPRDGGRAVKLKVAYSQDGRSILSYDVGATIHRWNAITGKSSPIHFKMPNQTDITSKACALNGEQLAFGYFDGSIRLWNCQTGTVGPVLEAPSDTADTSGNISLLVYSPSSQWIVSVCEKKTVRLWDLRSVELKSHNVDIGEDLEGNVCAVVFSPTSDQFAVETGKGSILLFDLTGKCLRPIESQSAIFSMVYSHDGGHIAVGTIEGKIYLWDLGSTPPLCTILEGHKNRVKSVAYSQCGEWIASGSDDKTVGIWHRQLSGEVESWSRVHSIRAFFGHVENVEWNPNDPTELVTGCSDGSVHVWRMSTEEGGKVTFKMVWGPNLGLLYVDGLILKNTIGLRPFDHELLVQRGATYLVA